jgi:tripeptidyl-peptidase-1
MPKPLPSSALYNATNAGFPDVSIHGENCILTQFGVPVPVSGTSCSAPVFAGLVALLNDARLSAGKPALGWLNPLLYKHPEAFTDITKGSTPGCASDGFQVLLVGG